VRRAWILVVLWACGSLAACTQATTGSQLAASRTPERPPPRLAAPMPVLDLDTPSAVYRTAVALHLQPAWSQFLDDCRLRLPRSHPLNRPSLAATANLAIDTTGAIAHVSLGTSGNADFDRAVRQLIADAGPLPRPPRALWSDDDRVHLRWLFARDRRQAGPATAQVVEVWLPLHDATRRSIETGDLSRAARRIAREPVPGTLAASPAGRDAAISELMLAGLREALDSHESIVQRAALDAIAELDPRVARLLEPIPALLAPTHDIDLRVAALRAAAATGMRDVVFTVTQQLRHDVRGDRALALAQATALIALGARETLRTVVAGELSAAGRPNATAVWLLSLVAIPELAPSLERWQRDRDAALRAAVCAAAARADRGWQLLAKGLGDRDAAVRAACLAGVAARAREIDAEHRGRVAKAPVRRVRALLRDRDARVRAAAFSALVELQRAPAELARLPDLGADSSAEVRAANASGLGVLAAANAGVHDEVWARISPLLSDRDPDVRAAAWNAAAGLVLGPPHGNAAAPPPAGFDDLLRSGVGDPAPQVRRAVVGLVGDEAVLQRIATFDDDAVVKTRALVRLVEQRGRPASANLVLDRFGTAPAGSAERVRTAFAWLRAR
jgi:hypothetical protein